MVVPPPAFARSDPGSVLARAGITVFPEQAEKLAFYQARLAHWQKAVNLVSSSTLADAARRHFLDSAQIAPLLPPTGTLPLPSPMGTVPAASARSGTRLSLVDLGSGAGFPGLVLAILRPDLIVHLVESDAKKCAFLQTVSRETHTPVQIYNGRIEDVWERIDADLITARALSSLPILFGYAAPWFARRSGVQGFFLKGREAVREVEEARSHWDFKWRSVPSLSDEHGCVLAIGSLSPC